MKYADSNGKPMSLGRLVVAEPEWAANRIRFYEELEAELVRLRQKIDMLDGKLANDDKGSVGPALFETRRAARDWWNTPGTVITGYDTTMLVGAARDWWNTPGTTERGTPVRVVVTVRESK